MGLIKNEGNAHPDALEKRGRNRDCHNLIQQLGDANPTARRWAARDLLDCPEASQVLAAHVLCEQDLSVREVILTSLTQLADEVALRCLIQCLRHENAGLRNEAMACLQQMPRQAAPFLKNLLLDEDSDIRIYAVNVLAFFCHPEVEQWLIDLLMNDKHVNVCAAAIDVLAEVGSPEAQDALNAVKQRFAEDAYIQFAANLALTRATESRQCHDKNGD